MLSFAATLCFFCIIKVTFSFFTDDLFVTTVPFCKFILFGRKQFILHSSCHSLAIDSTLDVHV